MTQFCTLLCLVVIVIAVIVTANRLRRVNYNNIEERKPNQPLSHAGADLRVLTWNIGYGALGKDADLYVDGGRSLRTLSKPQIAAGSNAIAQNLSRLPCDIMCLQEVAQAGILTRNLDVRSIIDEALPNRNRYFWTDLKTVLLPPLLSVSHGMATYTAKMSNQCRIIALPDATAYMLGFAKKPYVGMMNTMPIRDTDKAWVIINIHLPIFNTTPATRAAQLGRLFDVAKQEYDKGNYVVIAGDWNTRLCETSFEHTTDPKFLTIYENFPQDSLPDGWKIGTDPKTPTVRAIHSAFAKGQTYTTIFDGFVVSPNVQMSSVTTLDQNFTHSDHQLVKGHFSAEL